MNVLIENIRIQDGHGATIGSVPDANGLMGDITNITFRNLTMNGDAPLKFKTWPK